MAELQRSVTSFRRQGSSGSVWDDKFLSSLRDQNQNRQAKPSRKQEENERDKATTSDQRHSQSQSSVESKATLNRSRSAGARPCRKVNVATPSGDPPSPKAICGLCGFFGKPVAATPRSNRKAKKRT